MFDTGLWVLSMSITPTHISICLVQAATVSLGIIGAGTNNARIAGMLRNLSSYYYKDPSLLFCVRIAQGLVHMGKGLLTLNPYHSDRFMLSKYVQTTPYCV
jgi:hypothetical protein